MIKFYSNYTADEEEIDSEHSIAFNCEDTKSPDARLFHGLGQQVDRVIYFPNLTKWLAVTRENLHAEYLILDD